ncbi:MAG: V-type ATPase subunit [Caldicoprobacterales bacterium]|jgi:V/A-type H+-transporting ATPase subunit C
MSEKQFIYAVARIRFKEMQLLDTQFINQLLSSKSYRECLQLLLDKGWGEEGQTDPDQILAYEKQKTWDFLEDLIEDMSVFDILFITNDYHNLKAAIKLVYTGEEPEGYFLPHGTISSKVIMEAVKKQEFELLPNSMAATAKEAYEILTRTGDGQLCDLIVDRAAMEALQARGKKETHEVLKTYAELTVATANIKIAVRAQSTGKSPEWIRRALIPCDTIDVEKLFEAATSGMEEIIQYLSDTIYADGVDELKISLARFERWCNDLLIQKIKPQKYNPYTIGPLVAYILARRNEIQVVRIILLGKLNQLPDESIRERIRELYV